MGRSGVLRSGAGRVCDLTPLVTLLLLLSCFTLVQGVSSSPQSSPSSSSPSSPSSSEKAEDWRVPWMVLLPQHHRHANSTTTTTTGHHHSHHKHYHDQNNHKVRHHHERRLRRRFIPNQHAPKFSHTQYQSIVPENLPVGSSILQVQATDDDMDINGLIRYSVSDPEHFSIDDGGILTNIKPLDYEHTQGEYRLYVYAEDQGPLRSARKMVRVPAFIQVKDTAEPPYFENTHYTFAITESAAPQTYVGTVVARDADLDFKSYNLTGVKPEGTFMVESDTGIITVGVNNAFAVKRVFNFKAEAHDQSGLHSSTNVTVNIIDENTHKPVFNQCAELDGITVRENSTAGLPVVTLTAHDEDFGPNGEVTYSLSNDFDSFAIQTKTGSGYITTTRTLDRDGEDKEFFLMVIAKDGAPNDEALQEACTFSVIVEDINDNPPIFDKPSYEQNIATDHGVGTSVLRVTATDIDMGTNAEVSYSLDETSDDTTYFSIDEGSGIISLLRALDESMADIKKFRLTARATDKGAVPLATTAPVVVNVVSSGSLPPSISLISESQPIPENAPLNTEIATYCADSNVPGEPEVFFLLVTGNTGDTNADGTFATRKLPDVNTFCPPESRGVVIYLAVGNLDYETITQYKLILQVVNMQNAKTDQQLIVQVQDVNDIHPILQPFDGAITENSPPILITTIRAVDKDASPEFRNLVYSFDGPYVTPDLLSKFSLSPDGQLRTLVPLDREAEDKYRIPVHVTDGDNNRTSMYWITVKDMNDVPPTFDMANGVYEVLVPEDKAVGKNTGIVLKVTDPDIVNHNDFQIVEGNDAKKFSIDSTTGDVKVAAELDYDDPVRDRNFTMLVRLSDGANEMAETYITIAVININDKRPEFEPNMYSYTVMENVDCDKPFGQVSAIDPDLPFDVDQNITYYLQGNEKTNFSIDARTGELSIVGCLDREAATRGSMIIYPMAKDCGGTGLEAKPPTVTVNISDQNDNHPYIQSPDDSFCRFMENTDPAIVPIVVIQLSDLDSPEHGCPCTLAFDASTPPGIADKFQVTQIVDATSRYEVRPLVMLDREAQKVYKLPFRTTDAQGVNGIRYLTVEVGDKNDSPMTDGKSAIQVYNYLGQFPSSIIGSVYVTDLDDYDVNDKVFEIDASTPPEVDTYFDVDYNTGNITMQKDTPSGTYVLRVKVEDRVRNETAIGEVVIKVVDLTEEAVMQSGSFRVVGYSSHSLLQQEPNAITGTSMYERLKEEIGKIHKIPAENVDIFSLRDFGTDVDVRYNCHNSPYYTSSRLNGVMLSRLTELNTALGATISRVNLDRCLYENDPDRPCDSANGVSNSCQQTLKPNMTSPLVVTGQTTTMVGVDITDQYDCTCGALEPLPSVCYEGYCLNGGECVAVNNTLICECPSDNSNYGPRCEIKSARFERGYAWYEPPKVCENSSIYLTFQTRDVSGILLYSGPTVAKPWSDYPRDFLYVALRDWVLEAYLDLGSGTVRVAIPLEKNTERAFDSIISWDEKGIYFEVINCSGNSSITAPCRKSVPLVGGAATSHLMNILAPLQLGGVAAMITFDDLAKSYGWTLTPPSTSLFYGCVLELRHNDYLYDLNATDYDKNTYKPCDAPAVSKVIMGRQSIVIIVVSLLILILLVLLILCLARRSKKAISYPDLDGVVKESIGTNDLEGFGETDKTDYDLKLLRVGPNGYLFSDAHRRSLSYTNPVMHEGLQGDAVYASLRRDGRPLPDVADETLQKRKAPIALMPEGLSIGEFIDENIKKVDKDPSDFDDVRHYCYEGDAMSIASLSSIGSGASTDSSDTYDYKTDWGPKFEKLNQVFRRSSDEEDDSDYEFSNIPKQRKRASLPPPVTETTPPESPVNKPVTTSRPTDEPTVTFTGGDAKTGSSSDRPQQPPPPPPSSRGAEAFNPLPAYGELEGEESWC